LRLRRAFCVPDGVAGRAALLFLLAVLAAPALRAEYVVLRSGQRVKVTGYQLQGDKYHLQLSGGFVDVPAGDVVSIEPEDTFAPLPAAPQPAAGPQPFYRDLVEAAAKRYNMDADLITSVIAVESNFDPKAVSPKNARGLMQLLPETAAQLGVKNIDDPAENIDAGTRYLRDLLQKYNNDLALALAAYNAGPDKVQLYGRVPPYAETISYVRRVKRGYEKSKSAPSAKTPASPVASAPLSSSASPVTPGSTVPIVPPAPIAASSPPRTNQP
jgi:soluble lytic murein transglycosylase-like protein